MDPNTGKKNLFNKLNKEQALKLLKKENFKRKTVSFYRYVIIDNPHKLRDSLYREWLNLGVLGRIYLAHEGINAQISLPEDKWKRFKENLDSHKIFSKMPFKILRLKMMVIHFLN